ncbi:ribonuclease T2 [Monaibacterium marinum]|uniref:Ribonuclease T2 n=1 Tax=Pontivivens marinum TaxID=1690039 RepID=A0A2C9CSP5_9RHOB|nr:ribonuclease T2 [Monaibacterium marinum]SOH94233.1 ribonuclease T2 [Monaibacterium marinum]
MRWFLALLMLALPARADGDAGVFDYYVLSLSWSPSWCAATGDAQGSEQCDRSLGFVLHGLWPQYESGWPEYCGTSHRDPSRRQTGQMADIMGTGGAAWHQWQKHGRCSGLSATDFFALSREGYERVERPAILRRVQETLRLDPSVIEAAFLEVNEDMEADGVTVTCRDSRIQEVRICLTRDLEPRRCGRDVIRDCSYTASLPPVR